VTRLDVDCYSGYKADERPVCFRLEGRKYCVKEVLEEWREPDGVFYKVCADDGNLYVVRQETSTPEGLWYLVSVEGRKEN
jgi:hypothetical protein